MTPLVPKPRPGGTFTGALPPRAAMGFLIAVGVILAVAVATWMSLESRRSSARSYTRTLETLQDLALVRTAMVDAETGQRGYLLSGQEDYLAPFHAAGSAISLRLVALRSGFDDDSGQRALLDQLKASIDDKFAEMDRTIDLRRAGNASDAIAIIMTDRGRSAMDRIRTLLDEMETREHTQLDERQSDWDRATYLTVAISMSGFTLLLILTASAASMTARDHRIRENESWQRASLALFVQRIQGEYRLDQLGQHVLAFLAAALDARVGAVFVASGGDHFRRIATWAMEPDASGEIVLAGEGLLGQAAKEARAMIVRDVPDGYLPVASSLGTAKSREILVSPAVADGIVQAVVELGFFRRLDSFDAELLDRVSQSLAAAVRASRDRTRLEELLEETQRQAEELQTQQEELRVNNEELEEQGRALKESQVQQQNQQAELEQTNTQLEEQTQLLEAQRDELSQTQLELVARAAELERANQYKSDFLANMSHELRTPLNSSLILAKLLADNKNGNLTEEQVRYAQTISGAGNDLLNLINDILDLSRIEAGRMEIVSESVLIAQMVDALMRTFDPVARQRKLEMTASIDANAPARIETDGQRLLQILRNLLSNALKFTPQGSVILRVHGTADGRIAFSVRDTGIGIPSDQHDAVFEAFRQAEGGTQRKFGGSGLGLSISRDLAHLLGGDLKLESQPGEGSTFTLRLPAMYRGPVEVSLTTTAPTMAPIPPSTPSPLPMPRAPANATPAPIAMDDDRDRLKNDVRRILVIEDDPRFAEILRDLAHEFGFQCIVTHTAADGLAAAGRYAPNAVLLDLNLPDHSGLGVLDQLKRDPHTRHIPVHIASVADYAHEALELGAVGYALKPVNRAELESALRRLEQKMTQGLRRVLVVEDDERQRDSIRELLGSDEVQIVGASSAGEALDLLKATTFDCIVMDLNLPDLSGYELLEKMAEENDVAFPPVIVYTGRALTRDEEMKLRRYSRSIIVKDARSPERLLDEVTLFLHQVESSLSADRQRMLKAARSREASLEGRTVLVVEDDVRNIFALSSILEPKGARVELARNGREAIEALERAGVRASGGAIDLVLMDIMMPEMDGFTAMREIRLRPEWKRLPIIALTAKAMKDDHDKCLAAGANDYIAKPLDVERLLSLVRVWMPR